MTPIYTAGYHLQRWAPLALLLLAIALTVADCQHPLDRKHGNW